MTGSEELMIIGSRKLRSGLLREGARADYWYMFLSPLCRGSIRLSLGKEDPDPIELKHLKIHQPTGSNICKKSKQTRNRGNKYRVCYFNILVNY